jgi:hypothetical protein
LHVLQNVSAQFCVSFREDRLAAGGQGEDVLRASTTALAFDSGFNQSSLEQIAEVPPRRRDSHTEGIGNILGCATACASQQVEHATFGGVIESNIHGSVWVVSRDSNLLSITCHQFDTDRTEQLWLMAGIKPIHLVRER